MSIGAAHGDLEAGLDASEALYRATFDKAALGIAHVGLDGRWLRVNDRLCEIIGYAREELLGRAFSELTHPDDLPDNLAHLQALLEGSESVYVTEKRYRGPDGTDIWVKLSTSLLRDGQGRPEHLISVMDDISDRKRAEAALRESEFRLRLGLDAAGVGLAEWDHARHVFRVDARISALSHGLLAADTWLSMDGPERAAWVARVHPDDWAANQADRQAQAEGSVARRTIEFRVRHPGGGWRWISRTSAVLARDHTGRSLRVIDALQDITERKQGEERLARALDGLPQMAWLTRRDGTALYYNRRVLEYAGPGVGPSLEDRLALIHPEDTARMRALSQGARSEASEFDAEARVRRHDGAWRWHRLHAVALDAPESGGLAVSTAIDIHDIKEAERVLAEANAELERRVADRTRALSAAARELEAEMGRREETQAALLQAQKLEALGRLTGGVAHDLNNVLVAVTGSYELIRRRVDDPALLRLVQLGEQGASRAAALVRQLLAFARRETLKPVLVDVAALLDQVESLARHTIGPAVTCVLDVEAGIWPVLVDPQQLEMALLNLAVNARDAMEEGGTLRISARNQSHGAAWTGASHRGPAVAIAVTDTGSGMSPQVLARACEPFFTTKPRDKGTGLGLATARGFAEQSGGALHIESRVGQGTTVTILLPAAHTQAARGADATHEALETERHANAVVLLVDDDEQGRPVTAALLRELGHAVIEASDPEDALALVSATPVIDLMITDVIMPGTDGPTLAARVRAERPNLPVLFITGHPGAHALDHEVVLAKPFTARELRDGVVRALGRPTFL